MSTEPQGSQRRPLSQQIVFVAHIFTILASFAFSVAAIMRLSENGTLPTEPSPHDHDPIRGPLQPHTFFSK